MTSETDPQLATLATIGEDELVRRLVKGLPQGPDVLTGPGDDCAVVQPLSSEWSQLLKTDCVVEGVHFLREAPPEQVGWKALARVVSDLGAMGGEPMHALITLILPSDLTVAWVESLYAGLRRCAEVYGVSLVGGETARGPAIIVSVSMTGRVPVDRVLKRDGAKVGDHIVVTGRLGGSLAGHHLTFHPRVKEAQWLAANFPIHAMMDLSDGLAKDLPRMAGASGVEFAVDEEALPLNPGCSATQGWSDGEDYELLFAVDPPTWEKMNLAWAAQVPGIPLTSIGTFVEAGQGKRLSSHHGGWEHFTP
ncbi:MAG: thiamine-phosphate kinase [Verrucomicrobium sp.]|nr:thiamine-phosphate kinase [Verrucomicrobium sp.]